MQRGAVIFPTPLRLFGGDEPSSKHAVRPSSASASSNADTLKESGKPFFTPSSGCRRYDAT